MSFIINENNKVLLQFDGFTVYICMPQWGTSEKREKILKKSENFKYVYTSRNPIF